MESISAMQKHLLNNPRWVRIGDEIRRVIVHAPFAFFCGDAKELDMVAGRYNSYGQSTRLSRSCDISQDNAATPGYPCMKVNHRHVKKLVMTSLEIDDSGNELMALPPASTAWRRQRVKDATSALEDLCQHRCYLSLWKVDLSCHEILPLPHDMMHIMSTIIKLIHALIISCLTDVSMSMIDLLVDEILCVPRSAEKYRFPRCFFQRGVTSIKGLTSEEWTGMLITFLILSQTIRGRTAMEEVFTRVNNSQAKEASGRPARRRPRNPQEDVVDGYDEEDEEGPPEPGEIQEEAPTNPITVDDFIDLMEDLLEFQAFYKYGYPYDRKERPPPQPFCVHVA
jgi:hypothetical protein